MPNQLDQLKQMTSVVADTGDIEAIREHQPEDATTNPSLILKAALSPRYKALLQKSIDDSNNYKSFYSSDVGLAHITTELFSVRIGKEITELIPGRISTEVDARLSFDTAKMLEVARRIIALYESHGVSKQRILIKIAATWEGIRAAEILEKENIQCNLTLIFNYHQAIAAAQAGVFLISPFVGRILDWYKSKHAENDYKGENDPGVQSVKAIFESFKKENYETIVMGASFRSVEQIQLLAGCDKLTISPDLLTELQNNVGELPQALYSDVQVSQSAITSRTKTPNIDEVCFRSQLNLDMMATEKLAEGINKFSEDQLALEELINQILERKN